MSEQDPETPLSPEANPQKNGEVCACRECPKTRLNWALLGLGMLALVVGHFFLALAGREGTTLCGRLSPFLIVGGYALFGCGLINWKNRED